MDLIDALQTNLWFFVSTLGLLGLLVGSFLNVVIYRLPKMMEADWKRQCVEYLHPEQAETQAKTSKYNLVSPRSACPSCGHQITALENIPVLSYVVLGGKCSACKAPIGVRYPAIEAITGILTALLAWKFGFGVQAFAAIVLVWAMIALTFIDADTTLLPDDITLPLLWLGLIVNVPGTFTTLPSAVFGAVGGYLALWSVYWLFKLTTGKEGMGYGDFKLLGAIGAWLGWQMLGQVILLSAAVGAVVGIVGILLYGREKGAKIPFGPYLAAAGVIALVWGAEINRWYWSLGRS
ncbi:MAG: prepilin peptidase [Rhodocyclaceae bacterium]|nr:prepilin peptidase [Rhodocyclaceae bacterium]